MEMKQTTGQAVLVPQMVSEPGRTYLRDRGYVVKEATARNSAELATELHGCSAWLASTLPMDAAILEGARDLQIIARHGVGYDNIDLGAAERLGIWVTITPEGNFNTVAEHTIMMILVLARRLFEVSHATRGGDFGIRSRLLGGDVEGRMLGIVGLGRIGRSVAQKAHAGLGMRITAYDQYVPADQFPEYISRAPDLSTVLRDADVVTIHTPATAETRRLIRASELSRMKRGATLINCARGGIVEEAALISALRSGHLSGAAVDVFEQEPPAKDNPLLNMDNVVVTPHNAGGTVESNNRIATQAAMDIDAVLRGGRPRWPINNPPVPRSAH